MEPQIKRGFLDVCVMASMASGESYGYQIIKDFPDSIGMSESTLYPLLKRLESKGFIKCRKAEHAGRLRKYYSLTSEGREELESFLDERRVIDDIFDFVERSLSQEDASTEKSTEECHSTEDGHEL